MPLFTTRLKTRVALLELLDLSDIAIGNVGVPICLFYFPFFCTHHAEVLVNPKVRAQKKGY
jgi:hypothetical protein